MPRWTRRGDAPSLREWYSLREAERWRKREGLATHRNKKRRKAEHVALVSAARDGRIACLLRQRPIEDNPHSRGGRRWFSWDRGYLQHCGAECALVVVLPFVPPHMQDDAVRERIPEVEHCFRNSRAPLSGTSYTLLSRDCPRALEAMRASLHGAVDMAVLLLGGDGPDLVVRGRPCFARVILQRWKPDPPPERREALRRMEKPILLHAVPGMFEGHRGPVPLRVALYHEATGEVI